MTGSGDSTVECEIWWARPVDRPSRLLELLDPVERERHGKLLRAEDRARFASARALAKLAVAARVGIRPEQVRFDATCPGCGRPHGKPHVVGVTEPPQISLSHSGDRVVVALTATAPVGIDVERVAPGPVDPGLLGATLSESERATLEEPRDFFTYWTRKEALLKATGEGLTVPMDEITLSPPEEPPRVLDAGKSTVEDKAVLMADLDPGSGYRACVAVLGPPGSVRLRVTELAADEKLGCI